ncbi:DNA polymerase kappa [Mucuna pruriens]|uniref:DNA polymerase kappa n=1 Tax=Mucuna pruriens TaxID=157652 RepID=A0A371H899_MUCPR|nr:DNA polymerase kappa [Mucuna pruriens]
METETDTNGDTDHPWQSYHTVYTTAKAGMDGVDKEKVQRVVYEMSKGSKYFQNEERKDAFINHKIDNLRVQCAKLTQADLAYYHKVADRRIVELEASRDLSRIWLHVDMDAFYAAVETLSNPTLKGKPMAVGNMSMISTANYEARKFGVRAAMPGFIARKLCPQLIFVPTDFKKYDPNFIAGSLDEAYLDITEVCKERNVKSEEIAQELRAGVYEETGLTCSAGVAPNRLLAKVCSDINKPNGQYILPNERMAVMTFVSSLPIRKIGGIGKVTEHILKGVFGINTCEQMLEKSSYLCALFSQSTAGLGLGQTDAPQVRFRKSISNERTFSATEDEVLLHKRLVELAEMLSADMQKEGLCGRTLTLKLKTAAFEVRTRAVTLQKYISSSEDILKHAKKLLKAELPISVRLIGLRVSQFNGDKCSATSDPTQKTITNFITSGDVNSNCSSFPDAADHDLVSNAETDLSIDSGQTSHLDWRELFDGNHSSDVDHQSCTVWQNGVEEVQTSSNDAKSSHYSGFTEEQFEGINVKNGSNLLEDERLDSCCQEKTMLWLNDYKCSLCGIELPPSFVEERLEHSDFHLAEKLQKEESRIHQTSVPSQSRGQKDRITRQSNPKRQKLSQKEGSPKRYRKQETENGEHRQLNKHHHQPPFAASHSLHSKPNDHHQHDERGSAGQVGRSSGQRKTVERGWWKDSRNQPNERAETSHGREQREEKPQGKLDDNTFQRRDGFSERKDDPPPTLRKRPAFREKKIPMDSGDANLAATLAVKSSQIDHPHPPERKEERSSNPHHLDRPEKQFADDRAHNKGEARGRRYGVNDSYKGRDKFNGRQGYGPGNSRTEKWKHDLYQEVNKDPIPQKNEDDQIAKLEALLAS